MELVGRYDFKFSEHSQVFVYGGPAGAAALGPTPFPHRSSASENPIAVIGHHQQDSTHIATNVVTLGFAEGPVQVEASTFHGREPNETRWNIGKGKPDSFATRLTIALAKSLSAQFSTGRINNPEALDPNLDTVRTTASVHHNLRFSSGHLSSSLIWGRNKDLKNGARRIFNSYNLEVTMNFLHRNWVWTLMENVDRDRTLLPIPVQPKPSCRLCCVVGFDLAPSKESFTICPFNHVILDPEGTPVTIEEEPIGRIQAYTLGYERELPVGLSWLNLGLGVQATTYGLPPQLKTVYGARPSTVVVFLRLRPNGNLSEHMKLMHQHK